MMLSNLRYARGLFAQCLLALALIAASVHSAIPQGYMLDRGTDGSLSVVFCTGQGSATRWVNLETGEVSDTAHGTTDQDDPRPPCTAAMAAADAPLVEIATWVPTLSQSDAPAPLVVTRAAATPQDRLPPARAPPATL
ncbi:DUF2946 family protein [Maricaulis parjimensis]|uniref:DUF2946 family protein n=1 Tax=Maricaulis parjimensis TaxID=144023 RepID=UPI0030846819